MKSPLQKHDLLILILILGFVYVAAQRLGAVPLPETDEAYTLQVPYEMLYHGKLALPMLRYLGGNIENVWHSYTPVYFVLLSAFLKVFGFGLVEGRAFNLFTAALTLLITYLIGRRLFNWRAGLVAAVLLMSDITFLDRSRLLRNDHAAAFFAMLAFYLYEVAEQRARAWLYVASGLAAGAGVMCHPNILYMLGAICILMLITKGWRMFRSREFYAFSVSAVAVMAYEIIYDIIDYKNFLLQNRGDRLHFQLLEPYGWWRNIRAERFRYIEWFQGSELLPQTSQRLLHIFQLLAAVALVYLLVVGVRQLKRKAATTDPRLHVLLATVAAVLFLAVVAGNKRIYYIANLAPWFALCAAILVSDGMSLAKRLQSRDSRISRFGYVAVLVVAVIGALAYGRDLVRQNRKYLRAVLNPDLVSFEEVKSTIRTVVPDGLCPVAVRGTVMWLVFPEADRCFASIQSRMRDRLDIDGKDYAFLVPDAQVPGHLDWVEKADRDYHLIGELKTTAYGDIRIYYTGADPRYLGIVPERYWFFDKLRGHVSDEQVARAREVWSAGPRELGQSTKGATIAVNRDTLEIQPIAATNGEVVELASTEVESDTIYQVSVDVAAASEGWTLIVLKDNTWEVLLRKRIDPRRIEELFRTPGTSRVKLALLPPKQAPAGSLSVSGVRLREVAPL